MTLPTLAFVVPWYGAAITGGAETECRKTAEQLQRRGFPVEVLTTCARQFHSDWGKNYHRPSVSRVNGVRVRRFKLCPRDGQRFHTINLRLMRGYAITADDEADFMQNMVNSRELYDYIGAHQNDYRFVFIPYMFGTTYWGAKIAPQNSFIIPCLHEEAYAHMRLFKPLMQAVRGLILHSPAERELAQTMYELPDEKLFLLGEGVDTQVPADADAFRHSQKLSDPYLIYVGRRDETKNAPLLFEYFARFKAGYGGALKLLLIGLGPLPESVRARDDVVDLGVVDEQTKRDALAGALCLCNPSLHESFSLVVMESWEAGRPVLVHSGCEVTVSHCQSSHGGLHFGSFEEFAACLNWMQAHPSETTTMGRQGQTYVRTNFAWDKIVARLSRLVYGQARG